MAFFRLILLAFVCLACIDNNTRPLSRAEHIAGTNEFGKTWQIGQIDIEIGTVTPHKCVTDNFITYYPNGTYEINEGATKCDPTDPPGITGTWSINRSQTKLYVDTDDSTQVWTIDETSAEAHKISSSFSEGHRTYTFTLSR